MEKYTVGDLVEVTESEGIGFRIASIRTEICEGGVQTNYIGRLWQMNPETKLRKGTFTSGISLQAHDLGKIIKSNKGDLEEFTKKVAGGGILRIRRVCLDIEFNINNQVATASLDEAAEIHQKLGQMLATAVRNQKTE